MVRVIMLSPPGGGKGTHGKWLTQLTGVVHIPLNNALDAGGNAYAEVRARFEVSWVRWNLLRTAFAVAGFGCLLAALVSRARG